MLHGLVLLPEAVGATARADRRPLRYEARPGAASKPLPASYKRHEPEKTPQYRVVQEHVQTLLEDMRARTEHGFGYLRHVEQTFYAYLDGGLHRHLDRIGDQVIYVDGPWIGATEASVLPFFNR